MSVRPLRIDETRLPGIGLRHDFRTEGGDHVGLVTFRSGRRELVVYSRRDDDEADRVVALSEEEAGALSALLGASRIVAHLNEAVAELPGITVARIEVPASSPYAGFTLGDTQARTRTGVSVVALVRGADIEAAPGPGASLEEGTILVAVGTADGLEQLTALIEG